MNYFNIKPRFGKKALCVLLSIIIAFGALVSIVFGTSSFQKWLGVKGFMSAYAQEFVDTKGATDINEEEMRADDHTIILENRDGSNTLYLFSEPVTFIDENDDLKTKDITIEKQKDKELLHDGYSFTNGQNDYRINFSEDSNIGINATIKDCSYDIIPIDNEKVSGKESVAKYLNETFEVFEYDGIYGGGTSLRFYPQLNGLKDEIVLNQNIDRNSFSFKLSTKNCSAELNEDNTISLIDNQGETIQTFSAPYAYDSEYKEGDFDFHRTDCEYSLEPQDDSNYIITVNVPSEWLNSKETVYPVIIDPTSINAATYRDAAIYSATPNTCYGSEQTAGFGKSSQYGYGRVYMQFLWPSAILQGAEINEAYIWEKETTGRTTDTTVIPYIVRYSWAESTITWNNRAYMEDTTTMQGKVINSQSTDWPSDPTWYKFHIEDAVQAWADGTKSNYGIGFYSLEEELGNYNWRAFATIQHSTSSFRPYTVIKYTNDETAPTVQNVTGNPTEWTNENVTLSINGAADNDGGIGLSSTPYSFSTTQGSYSWQASNQRTISDNGIYYIYVRDDYDNIRLVSTENITKIDKLKPYRAVITPNTSNWTQEVILSLHSNDRPESSVSGRSGTKYYSCGLTEGVYNWQEIDTLNGYGYIPVQSNGTYYIYAKDVAGNISEYNTIEINNIDTTAPVISSITDSISGDSITVTVNASDNESGLANEAYSFDGGQTWQSNNYAIVTADYSVKVRDSVGNITNDLPPAPEVYKENNLIHLFSQNNNASLQYKIGNGQWCNYTVPFEINLNTEVTVYVKDAANNTSIKSESFKNTLGAYQESETDFSIKYYNSSFDFSRYYNSNDGDWYYSIDSTATKVSDILYEVKFINGSTVYFEKQGNTNVYKNYTADISLEETSTGCSVSVSKLTYHYDINGKLDYIADKADHRINITRSSNSIEISYGNYSYVVSLSNGKPSSVTTPLGEVLTYAYYGGKLENVYYDGTEINISRGNNSEIDISAYSYYNDLLTDSMNKSITYDSSNRVVREEYTSGAYTTYSYSGNSITVTKSLGSETQTTTITYNNAMLPVEETLPDGTVNTYTYNSDHNLVSVSQTVGEDTEVIKEYTYNQDGTLHTSTEDGKTTTYYYNSLGLISRAETSDERIWYYYDSDKNITRIQYFQIVNGLNNFNSEINYQYTYDNSMVVSCVCTDTPNDKTTTTTYVYDSYGNAVSTSSTTTDGNNNTTVTGSTSTYDALGRVLTTTTDNNQVSYVYDSVGKVIRQTESQTIDNVTTDRVTRFIYDDFGRLLQQINPDYYSAEDDGLNNQTPVDTYSDSNVGLRYHYNYYTDVIDYDISEQEIRTDYIYVNGVLREEDFDIYHFDYNNYGNITEIDINNSVYATYAYNSKQKNTSVAYGNGQTVFYEYDTDDNLKYQKYQAAPNDAIEIQFEYSYNSDGELYCKADFATQIAEVYDNTNNTVTLKHFDYQNNQVILGTELATYSVNNNAQDETTSLIVEAEDNTYLLSTYGENSVVYSNGTNEYEYNITEDTAQSTKDISVYNNTLDSSIFDCEYSYNSKGQIESYTFTSLNEEFTYGYTYDEYGNITSYGKLVNNEFVPLETQYYYYDETNHNDLIGNSYYSGNYNLQEEYTYDSRGNILTYSENYSSSNANDEYETLTSFFYSSEWSDKLASIQYSYSDCEDTSINYLQYDAIGNPTKLAEDLNSDCSCAKYNWTNGRQLKSFQWCDENGTAYDTYSYTYNENGIRTSERRNNEATVYKMLMGDMVLAEFTLDQNMNITVTKQYLYNANQELVGHIANGKTYFYLKNAQGDIQAVINEEGLCVKIYNYSAWGKELDTVTPDLSTYTNDVSGARLGSSISNYYRGYEMDNNLYCYYLQSRYYDPYSQFRFINADIPQIAQQNKNALHGMNLFAYCADNPVMYSDTSGHEYGDATYTIAMTIKAIAQIESLTTIISAIGNWLGKNSKSLYDTLFGKGFNSYKFDLNKWYTTSNEKVVNKFNNIILDIMRLHNSMWHVIKEDLAMSSLTNGYTSLLDWMVNDGDNLMNITKKGIRQFAVIFNLFKMFVAIDETDENSPLSIQEQKIMVIVNSFIDVALIFLPFGPIVNFLISEGVNVAADITIWFIALKNKGLVFPY